METFNFNANCRYDGLEFENAVIAHEILKNDAHVVCRDLYIPQCGIEVDIVLDVPLKDKSGTYTQTLRKYIQVKGGKPGKRKRPGARRTDNVKKALADGFLFKTANPDHWFTLYFSEEPKNGSYSEAMLNTAVSSGIINEICYIGYED